MNNNHLRLTQIQQEYEDFLSLSGNRHTKPRIAAWGLVKAGKSSLLNMLSGHVADEYFETGAVRTTRVNRELETENYILVDTPGLGIDDDDTQEAYKGLESSDIILFVHAPQGELDREEIGFLDRINEEFGNKVDQRLIVVLTQLDKSQNRSIEEIRDKVLEQIEMGFGLVPACFLLSNTRYQKGSLEHKNVLIQKSGIPELALHLDNLIENIKTDLDESRIERTKAKRLSLLKSLDDAIVLETTNVLDICKAYEEKARRFNDIMQKIDDEYKSIKKELEKSRSKLQKI